MIQKTSINLLSVTPTTAFLTFNRLLSAIVFLTPSSLETIISMAMAVIDVIGALAGFVGVGMMFPGLLPDKDEHQTVVRVAAGLSTDDGDTTSGNQPGINLYDVMGRRIGSTKGKEKTILDGDFMDISVPFDDGVGKKLTEYLSIVNWGTMPCA